MNAQDLLLEYIKIPVWGVEGLVVAVDDGVSDARWVLLQKYPEDPHPRWYRLRPGDFVIEGGGRDNEGATA